MSRARLSAATLVILACLVVQRSVLPTVSLPGAGPDLVVLVILALALRHGSEVGAVTGFVAGLALDLSPPSEHALGRWAFALTAVGFLAGLATRSGSQSRLIPVVAVTAASAAAPLVFAATGAAIGFGVPWPRVAEVATSSLLYALVLSPLVLCFLRRRPASSAETTRQP